MTAPFRTLAAATAVALTAVAAQANPMVGGAPMYASKNIIQNAVNSKDHTTLVAAVKAAGLVKTLEGKGPFTVFAPTNEAFAKLPKGTVQTLLKPENKAKLQKILTCHVLAGKETVADIEKVAMQTGEATLNTLGGCKLTAFEKDGKLMIRDENGDTAMVTIPDVMQSNGVIQVINTVMLPKS
ncbi:fasciclin [Defluviimonas sp. 20V17]|uniref:Fasciclin n=1 Tax=Allgaiera indica TaxID=765699 RepID=A0AAN4UTF0_9RHOB|nr:fasciclin domain-containing protein [Allgaiera indica]KDB01650.1 fasciclin [Defluviimonas sp. 20V17]GHE03940.1 fasciclin [Allgaiera indica]SDX35320.1 Uncaracterized surface protein containing fasciclin (FAS1) repeats [Allgaiera indica]